MIKSIEYITILLLLMIVTFTACLSTKIYPLNMDRTDIEESPIKLNGYYYKIYGANDEFVKILFLYKNGVILDGSSFSIEHLADFEKRFRSGMYAIQAQRFRDSWGVYSIKEKEIKIEQWYSGNRCCETFLKSGDILSSSEFHIRKAYNFNDNTMSEKNEFFKFKPFHPKPDSTNTFIN